MQRPLWNRFATFLVWLLAAVCCVYWALKFVTGPAAPPTAALATSASAAASVDAQALAKGLGGGKSPSGSTPTETISTASTLQASRFVLTGVVVQRSGRSTGAALIAVDGKPARPYRVGASLADGVVLHSVSAGKAMLSVNSDTAPSLNLELPPLFAARISAASGPRPTPNASQPHTVMPAMPAPVPAATPAPLATPMAIPSGQPISKRFERGELEHTQAPHLANQLREVKQENSQDQPAR